MNLLIVIVAGISIIFGIGLLFAPRIGNKLAAITTLYGGMYAYDSMSLWPVGIAFVILWVLRLLGLENR